MKITVVGAMAVAGAVILVVLLFYSLEKRRQEPNRGQNPPRIV